jgi:precorrin-2 C20-methyltransferase/precorrin-3B C17-methyltransferase
MSAGRLYGVGLGPGDPELVTVKAARLVERAGVVAYHSARHGRSIARAVAEPYLREGQIEEALVYPVTTETTGHPGGYRGALDEFYAECAARLAAHLDAGRDVVVLCEGDPFFYGSYMHIHKRLSQRYTTDRQRVAPMSDVEPGSAPYFSLAVLPSRVAAAPPPPPPAPARSGPGEVAVVGLGPAGREWTTPEAHAVLAAAEELVGYGPYLDRVPPNPRQRRHPSDNTEEAARAAYALDLAAAGSRVAVVSSGDPGVFAMASAVLEAATQSRYADVPVRVVPGLTAAQAVASRAGAPLGHDYCVLSLSDRLKPWDVIVERLTAAARTDLVIAIYNPASRTRTWQVEKARDLLLEHRAPDTPVVVGRDVGGPAEQVRVVRLADLDSSGVDMRCLLIVGSSTTRHGSGGAVFTPRRYP